MNQAITYLKEVWSEFQKVSWPGQKQSYYLTALVILLSLVIAAYLGLFDQIFTRLFDQFFV